MEHSTLAVLTAAIDSKSQLTIIYLGGSAPGAERTISPISINPDTGKLRARCKETDAVKVFLIDKIRIPEKNGSPAVKYEDYQGKEYGSLEEIAEDFKSIYPEDVWAVEVDEQCLSVFGFFKNGKKKRGAECVIQYLDREASNQSYLVSIGVLSAEYAAILDDNKDMSRIRPWSVSTRDGAKSYKQLNRAALAFFETFSAIEARRLAGNK